MFGAPRKSFNTRGSSRVVATMRTEPGRSPCRASKSGSSSVHTTAFSVEGVEEAWHSGRVRSPRSARAIQLTAVAAKHKRMDLFAYGLLIGIVAGFLTDAIVTAAGA